jgi:hypothetical protein
MDMWQVETALNGSYEITCVKKEPCNPTLLDRIQRGMLDSKEAPNELKAYCRECWVDD